MSASNDGSESVDQFLARIASLSHKKDDEDAGRARKMDEDMMQARKERQARRAGTVQHLLDGLRLLTVYRTSSIYFSR